MAKESQLDSTIGQPRGDEVRNLRVQMSALVNQDLTTLHRPFVSTLQTEDSPDGLEGARVSSGIDTALKASTLTFSGLSFQ